MRMDRTIARSDDADYAATPSSPTSTPRFPLSGSLLSIAGVVALFIGTINLHHGAPRLMPGELVFPISPNVYAAAIFVATFIIVLFVGHSMVRGSGAAP